MTNKFRGDVSWLRPGIEMMEQRLGIPCAGVVPFLRDLGLEEEDSVAMEDRHTANRPGIAVARQLRQIVRCGSV